MHQFFTLCRLLAGLPAKVDLLIELQRTANCKLEKLTMSEQDDFNAMNAKVDTLVSNQQTLITATNDLTAEVKALKAANPGIDFSAVDAKLDAANAAVQKAITDNPDPGPQPNSVAAT